MRYARSHKPSLGIFARQIIIDTYRCLRSYLTSQGLIAVIRITVRQLEALIRLSEATARIFCDTQVSPNHVFIAVDLFLNSIQSVGVESHLINYMRSHIKKINHDPKSKTKQSYPATPLEIRHSSNHQKITISGQEFKI